MSHKLLSERKKIWAKNRDIVLKGKPLKNPVALEQRFTNQLISLVDKMSAITKKELEKLLDTKHAKEYFSQDASIASQARILINNLDKTFNNLFASVSGDLANDMVNDADKASKSALSSSLEQLTGHINIKTDVNSKFLQQTIKAASYQTASDIKNIPQTFVKRIANNLMTSITTGEGLKQIFENVTKFTDMSKREAKNTALNSVRRTYNQINVDRMDKVGIKQVMWHHSHGGINPRKDHLEMDGKIYDLDKPPVVDKATGLRGWGGVAYGCKCFTTPVIVLHKS